MGVARRPALVCPELEKYVAAQLSEKSSLQNERRKAIEDRILDADPNGKVRGKKKDKECGG